MNSKYIKSFREAVEKLEEDDGNPSITQAIDYDINNAEFEDDPASEAIINEIKDLFDASEKFLTNIYRMSSVYKIKGPQKNKVVSDLRTLARQINLKAYQALQLVTKSPDETEYNRPDRPSDSREFLNKYRYQRANGQHIDIANSDITGDEI